MQQRGETQNLGEPCTDTSHTETDHGGLSVAASHCPCLRSTLMESAGSLTSKQSKTTTQVCDWDITQCTD